MRISLRLCVFARHPLLPSPDLGLLNCSGHRVELLPLPARPRQPVENYAGHCGCAGEKSGAVIGYEITGGGAGYTTRPSVSVSGIAVAAAKVELTFGKDFESNGSVSAITAAQGKGK